MKNNIKLSRKSQMYIYTNKKTANQKTNGLQINRLLQNRFSQTLQSVKIRQ